MSVDNVTLIGVYDADGTLSGELRYWVGARLGRAHCSLCDITHGLFKEKVTWRECRETLTVGFETFHRNDAPREVLAILGNDLPAVVLRRGDEFSILLRSGELNELGGDVDQFRIALAQACASYDIEIS